jgi:RsiW-degrading membrane proteinase PrsW (M82 family)
MSGILFITTFVGLLIGNIILFWYWDRKDPEPFCVLVKCFFLGIIAAILERFVFRFSVCKVFFASDLFEFVVRINDEYVPWKDNPAYGSVNRLLFSSFVIGGILKEGLKFLMLSYALIKFRRHVDEPKDPLIYAFYIGLGFSLLDSFFHYYIDMVPFRGVDDSLQYFRFDFSWVLLRLFTVHMGGSLLMGLGYAMAMNEVHYETKEIFNIPSLSWLHRSRKLYIYAGFVLAILLHGGTTLVFGTREWLGIVLGVLVVITEMWLIWRMMGKFEMQRS